MESEYPPKSLFLNSPGLILDRYVQPWADDKRMKRTRVGNWIVLGFVGIAVVLSGYIMYTGAKQAQIPPVCKEPHVSWRIANKHSNV